MPARWNTFDPACPTRQLLDRVADKWTVLVLATLSAEPVRFGDLRRRVGGISGKVLTECLRSLERDGLIERYVHTGSALRVEYELTRLGLSLVHLLEPLRLWAETNMTKVAAARARRSLAVEPQRKTTAAAPRSQMLRRARA